mmetsp:Transcript_101472/g.287529  ORF Transcript_101472/g.287529 Transcript_101472/m.287529 type:complete len:241 (-) Transcript_101472:13-735(-)
MEVRTVPRAGADALGKELHGHGLPPYGFGQRAPPPSCGEVCRCRGGLLPATGGWQRRGGGPVLRLGGAGPLELRTPGAGPQGGHPQGYPREGRCVGGRRARRPGAHGLLRLQDLPEWLRPQEPRRRRRDPCPLRSLLPGFAAGGGRARVAARLGRGLRRGRGVGGPATGGALPLRVGEAAAWPAHGVRGGAVRCSLRPLPAARVETGQLRPDLRAAPGLGQREAVGRRGRPCGAVSSAGL